MPDHRLPPLSGPLAGLDRSTLAELASIGSLRRHDTDETLMRQGGRSDCLYVLIEGRARVTVVDAEGHELLLDLLGPGDTAGELSVIDGGLRSATVSALEPGRALRVAAPQFIAFLERRPRVAVALLQVLARRLRGSDESRLRMAAERTDQRVARCLLVLAAEHGAPEGRGVRITAPLTQAEMASWVGASREGVSHALRELREAGVITTDRRAITVRDLAGLREKALG